MTCLITCNGLTNAQYIKRVLDRSLINAYTCRVPKQLADGGCAYAVKVKENQLEEALQIIRKYNLSYRKIYRLEDSSCEEVGV
ncbi:MAG: DUF3343 domain-containing protein [Eubacteriales bacterium]|jgi:hypothetical protein